MGGPVTVEESLTSIENLLVLYCVVFSVVVLINTNSDALAICLLVALFFAGLIYYRLKNSKYAMRGAKTIFIFVFTLLSTLSDHVANFAHKAVSALYLIIYYSIINPAAGAQPATEPIPTIDPFYGFNWYLTETVFIVAVLVIGYYIIQYRKYVSTVEKGTKPESFFKWIKYN